MSYSVIGSGRNKQRQGVAIFDDLAEQERNRNSANQQLDAAAKAEKESTIATSAGMLAASAPAAIAGAQAAGSVAAGMVAAGPMGWMGLAGMAIGLFS